MSAASSAGSQGNQGLAAEASRVADAAGGGLALVYVLGEGDDAGLRLRAAAGFDAPDVARAAARELAESARRALASDTPLWVDEAPALGERAAGGVWARALGAPARGALVVAAPQSLSDEQQQQIDACSHDLARQLGADSPEPAPKPVDPVPGAEECGGDELLRLSEALFAQDVELLRSREQLGKIERLKDDFIEKMSRELRTPLNHIIEAIISVLTGEDEALSETAKKTLRTALDEGSAFQRTLQNILDLWRIKQGELPVELQDVNFRELVDEAIFSVQDSIGERPVVIETELVEPLPHLRTDLTKLNQILFLLVDNAVKFTNRGTVRILGKVAGGRLDFEVRDEGIGICHDDLEYIFDEFYQVDESESQLYRGAGLGLTLVRDLVSLLDGELSIESDIGRGTRVTVSLPVQTV